MKSVAGDHVASDSQLSARLPSESRREASEYVGATAARTSQDTSTSMLTTAPAGRGDMRDQGTETSTWSPSAVSGVVTRKLTLRSSPAGTGKARTSYSVSLIDCSSAGSICRRTMSW